MEKGRIIEVLSKWNFWKNDLDVGIPRQEYLRKILNFIKTDKVISVVGARRTGKSTLIKQIIKSLIQEGVNRNGTLMINFEEPEFENTDLKLLDKIYQAYREIIQPVQKPFLFLDEIQNVSGWERFVRSLNERKESFITISGSSSKLLSSELSTVLTGRQLYFDIFPLSFKEFLAFKGIGPEDEKDLLLNSLPVKKALREYLEFGGFPEVVLNQNPEFKIRVNRSYYEDIINKDIIQRFRIKKIEQMRALARFYLTNISSLMNFHKAGEFIKTPVETIRRFSSYLEAANLVFFIKRFSFSVKEQENSPRKVYSIDTGISNSIGFRFSYNWGKLLENVVAIELKRRQSENPMLEFYYWKDPLGKEVDFLVKENWEIKELIQVCLDISDQETKKREINSLKKAMKNLKIKESTVITEDYEGEDKKITYIPLWKWLYKR
ncbi:MAG: ATPase [bacterium (Candidatus Ratteibacteria) CG23_combo_of_CG06-09_8_20_14_all_48_7]|uniref:ATPase n=1 Tax=bacterium (Candidatus Ratteibacteria) CG23_combo_of_CG06-09_8_20_14_all_48_7 TaxID=2014292 RepID=A0A2G9YDH4_9BACT|nr:MAG: ATPase [bacterium (Candidatus Ratteibacteria) CG23_combo_of_CG06-09_8_20_14_all_48_7]